MGIGIGIGVMGAAGFGLSGKTTLAGNDATGTTGVGATGNTTGIGAAAGSNGATASAVALLTTAAP